MYEVPSKKFNSFYLYLASIASELVTLWMDMPFLGPFCKHLRHLDLLHCAKRNLEFHFGKEHEVEIWRIKQSSRERWW